MIFINLLDWRKNRFKQARRRLLVLFALALMLACGIAGIYGYKISAQIQAQFARVSQYQQLNQSVLTRVQQFESSNQDNQNMLSKVAQINDIVSQRNTIPAILTALAGLNNTGKISFLTIDFKHIQIKEFQGSLNQALALFQLLNKHPNFCHVAFTPAKQSSVIESTRAFEFEAQICHVQS